MRNANPLGFKTCEKCGNYYVGKQCPECEEDRPEYGKQYALTGAPGTKCIANGNTWAESVVKK